MTSCGSAPASPPQPQTCHESACDAVDAFEVASSCWHRFSTVERRCRMRIRSELHCSRLTNTTGTGTHRSGHHLPGWSLGTYPTNVEYERHDTYAHLLPIWRASVNEKHQQRAGNSTTGCIDLHGVPKTVRSVRELPSCDTDRQLREDWGRTTPAGCRSIGSTSCP